MGIQDLQAFLESDNVPGGAVPTDLLKIARNFVQRQRARLVKGHMQHAPANYKLVLDGECCLDRLYGGYFSDWACGGQWNHMVQFLAVLIQTTEMSGIEFAVFFNGCLETSRSIDWVQNQLKVRNKVNDVLKHISTKGTPPPKVWWIPPVCLRTSLRMAFRHLNVSVLSSMDDHHQEVIAYCRENNFNGIIANDSVYAIFDPPSYFSSEHLKLTYKGALESKEYNVAELVKALGIPADRLCIFGALLGNYFLTEYDLLDFYKKLNVNTVSNISSAEQVIKAVAAYVKELPSIELDAVAQLVFGATNDPRCTRFKQSVQYYMNGTKDGFLRYKLTKPSKVFNKDAKETNAQTNSPDSPSTSEDNANLEASRFASETVESEKESLDAYKQAMGNAKCAPEIVIDPPGLQSNDEAESTLRAEDDQEANMNGTHNLVIGGCSSSSSSSTASPAHAAAVLQQPPTTEVTKQQVDNNQQKSSSTGNLLPLPVPEVMHTASERHEKGLMSPQIYQILTANEIRLPVLLEDEFNREIPSIHLIYRPVRQMVYAIVFNLHHRIYLATKSKERGDNEKIEVPEIVIKEWVWSKANPYQTPDLVKAEQIGWRVPTIQRLWFGTGIDDKRRRLRGFLTCMKSDTPLMLNTTHVPQHLLVMACVLRYIMCFSDKVKVLRRQELDAFIVQAFSPELMNYQYLKDLQLTLVTSRGVQLATLFMAGVETALLANDACGAPIPWLMCCPWLYFDGKLFHNTLARATVAKNLLELCGGHIDRVIKVERMRKAILEGINVVFARPPLPLTRAGLRVNVPQEILPAGCSNNLPHRGGGLVRRVMPPHGGQLEIAGVVVGQWGPNYGQPTRVHHLQTPRPRVDAHRPPSYSQVTSVGQMKFAIPRGINPMTRPAFQTWGNNRNQVVNRAKKTQMKAVGKKKVNVKANDVGERKHGKRRADDLVDGLSELVTNISIKSKSTALRGQLGDAAAGGLRGVKEEGQGDASLTMTLPASEISTNGKPHQQ